MSLKKCVFLSGIILLLTIFGLFGDDWFPITAWGIRQNVAADTSFWVADIDTAWNRNSIVSIWRNSDAQTNAFFCGRNYS